MGFHLEQWNSNGIGKFAVVRREDGEVVGRVGIQLLDPETYISGMVVNTWKCNWRAAVENGHDASHAPMVHMNSPRMWLRPSGPQNRYGTPVPFQEPGMKGVYTPQGEKPNGEMWTPQSLGTDAYPQISCVLLSGL